MKITKELPATALTFNYQSSTMMHDVSWQSHHLLAWSTQSCWKSLQPCRSDTFLASYTPGYYSNVIQVDSITSASPAPPSNVTYYYYKWTDTSWNFDYNWPNTEARLFIRSMSFSVEERSPYRSSFCLTTYPLKTSLLRVGSAKMNQW